MIAYLVFGFNSLDYRDQVLGVFDNVMKASKYIKSLDNIQEGVDTNVDPTKGKWNGFNALDFHYSYFQIVKYNGDKNLGVIAKYDRIKREISLQN
jgi:hypothetical protein